MNKIKNLFVIILFALVALYCVVQCYEYDGLERQLD